MKIKLDHLLTTEQAEKVNACINIALESADPFKAVLNSLDLDGDVLSVQGNHYNLADYDQIYVVAIGKAALQMSLGLIQVLGDRISRGGIILKHLPDTEHKIPGSFEVFKGEHPVPGKGSVEGTRKLVKIVSAAQQKDLLFCLISGGGSALMTLPYPGISLTNIQVLTRELLSCGAEIDEINVLRKHLDQVKGGGLARIAAPAEVITLILSDVVGSPLDVIASGPTVPDPSTFQDAMNILRKYGITLSAPQAILDTLTRGEHGVFKDTLKPGDPIFNRVKNYLIGDNYQTSLNVIEAAQDAGFNSLLLTTYLHGEAHQVGMFLASVLKQISLRATPITRPALMVAGGETTVTLCGKGLGGRNQEIALGAVMGISGLEDVALLTLGTDGEDGPTDAAGALVTGETYLRGIKQGMNPLQYLEKNDSYTYFKVLDSLIQTGPTGTNVNDLVFVFAF